VTDLDVAIKARFVNEMGSGARGAERDIDGVQRSAQRLGASNFGDRMRGQLSRAAAGASALHDRLQGIGTTLISFKAGYEMIKRSLAAPVMADADFGDIVIDIAQKANIAQEGVAGLSDEIKGMAERLKSSPEAVGKGLDVLMSSLPDIDVSKRLIDPIVKVSKTYRVETDAISQAVFSMVNNLGVAPDKIEIALGRISQAAADGRYEISNFAEGLPGLAATMQGLGQTGLTGVSRLSAALETVSGSVGDPGQATTSIDDLLQKVVSPDVVKNFKDAGINIAGRIGKAQKEGTDVFEAIYKATMKATGGDTSKVVNFFGDKEARRGIVALMQNMDAYREMRDRYEAINSPDKLNSDFDMRIEGDGNSLRTFGQRWDAFQTSIGQGVNTYLKPALDTLTGILDVFTGLSEAVPRVTGAITLFATTVGAIAVSASIGAFLKRFAGMVPVATEAAAPAASAAAGAGAGAAAAGAGGIWRWLGKGAKVLPKALGYAGLAYSAYETAAGFGSGLMNSLSGPGATGEAAAARDKQRYDAQRRTELQAQIDGLQAKISEIVKAGGQHSDRGRAQIGYYTEQMDKIQKMMDRVGATEITPRIDPSSIDSALGKVSALSSALRGLGGPSFMGNSAPASARVTAPTGGGNTATTYSVAGYNPSVVARRIQREQDRRLALAQAGALHDTLSFA
jgi:TP901 family phage tail tape measure protein